MTNEKFGTGIILRSQFIAPYYYSLRRHKDRIVLWEFRDSDEGYFISQNLEIKSQMLKEMAFKRLELS